MLILEIIINYVVIHFSPHGLDGPPNHACRKIEKIDSSAAPWPPLYGSLVWRRSLLGRSTPLLGHLNNLFKKVYAEAHTDVFRSGTENQASFTTLTFQKLVCGLKLPIICTMETTCIIINGGKRRRFGHRWQVWPLMKGNMHVRLGKSTSHYLPYHTVTVANHKEHPVFFNGFIKSYTDVVTRGVQTPIVKPASASPSNIYQGAAFLPTLINGHISIVLHRTLRSCGTVFTPVWIQGILFWFLKAACRSGSRRRTLSPFPGCWRPALPQTLYGIARGYFPLQQSRKEMKLKVDKFRHIYRDKLLPSR